MIPVEVSYRWYCTKFCTEHDLVGHVQNTNQGTVIGEAQGSFDNLVTLVNWLEKIGSPQSRVSKLELKNCRLIDKLKFNEFTFRRGLIDAKTLEESEISKEIELELRECAKSKFQTKTS